MNCPYDAGHDTGRLSIVVEWASESRNPYKCSVSRLNSTYVIYNLISRCYLLAFVFKLVQFPS
jgi:hypothetical protein